MLRDIANTRRKKTHTDLKQIVYGLQDNDGVVMVGIKKEYIGFRKGNQNGISSMYNIR